MSELDEAIVRLEQAVARLEAAAGPKKRAVEIEDEQTTTVAATIAGRIDAALARLGRLLDRED